MKNWLLAVIVVITLAFGGIGEAQTKSQFPKPDKQDAALVEFSNCDDVIFSVVGYVKDNDPKYYVYEVDDTTFAVIEFGPNSDQSIAVYVLRPDKTVLKYVPSEYGKLTGPCETIKLLGLKNGKPKF